MTCVCPSALWGEGKPSGCTWTKSVFGREDENGYSKILLQYIQNLSFVVCEVTGNSLRNAGIHSIICRTQAGGTSVRPGSWSAFNIRGLLPVPLGQVPRSSPHLSIKLRSTCSFGNLSMTPISSHIYQDWLIINHPRKFEQTSLVFFPYTICFSLKPI